ncbi:MAG: nucleic acid-binding protein [Firmicutes bacterium ML8_F2]|nr:MAG: nucleic acid-binding protein [Firmicutes bacterium ML8_F2]
MKKRKVPMRVCIGCQEKKPKKELVRIVRTPNGEVMLDSTGKKAGRGAYICPQEVCLNKAIKARRLERNLQTKISDQLVKEITVTLKNYHEE